MALPAPAASRWKRPRVATTFAAIVAAFREALELRRAAHGRYRLDHE
jgi:hypothetical protein